MSGRRAIFGLCLICALALSAVAAQGASASNGLTAFTCAKEGPGHEFAKAHCREADRSGGEYEHVGFEGETETTISDETTGGEHSGWILHETIAGVPLKSPRKNSPAVAA